MSKQENSRPLIFGEVLFDCFPDGNAVLGGAPFNVAWHLQGFGLNPLMLSAVGDDKNGHRVLSLMKEWGMDASGIQILDEYPTGQVTVSLENGQPSYEICENQAYDNIEKANLDFNINNLDASLLYHGSLIARTEDSQQLLDHLKAKSTAPVFIDVNLRPPWWNLEAVKHQMMQAKWVKLNEEELITILEVKEDSTTGLFEYARELLEQFNLELVIVTQGEHGAFCISENDMISGSPVNADVVDTVGAGDSFSAVTILGLIRQWPLSLVLERALEFAAAVCEQRGATSNDPALYRKYLESWKA